MQALVLSGPGRRLELRDRPAPVAGPGQVVLDVRACGVCRTDLHIVDGELDQPALPLVPGHQIVGLLRSRGVGAERFALGQRVGVPWLASTCGRCRFCLRGQENLCDQARFTGYTVDGGFAEQAVADERFCFALPDRFGDAEAAPLLCAGFIGARALTLAGPGKRLGLYGFGAAAHLVCQIARHEGREVFAFTRPGDRDAQSLARSLGACWAGGSDQSAPKPLDAAILFAPVGALVPVALAALDKGGIAVCAGIHMSDIPTFPYRLLWGERRLVSVANLCRSDGEHLLTVAAEIPLAPAVTCYPLADGNRALDDLRAGRVTGAAVLTVG